MIPTSPHDPGVKAYLLGTHRTRPPAETLSRVEPAFDTFGITRIANITGLDRTGLPVVAVCRPNARSSAVFHGKGIDLMAAKTSGVMEAIEAWHAENVDQPLRLGSVADLKTQCRLIDTEGLPRCPTSQFRPDLRILWVQGSELIGGESVWVPFELVHVDGSMPPLPGSGCFASSTNGLASGNHILEATSHGLCELIERDATSLWNRMPRKQRDDRRVDITTIEDQTCKDVLARFEHGSLDVAVWETTTEIGVPSFQCMAVDCTGEVPHLAYGAGCHPTRSIALFRALAEAAQVRLTYILGSREDLLRSDYEPAMLSAKASSARRLMCSSRQMRDFGSIRTHEFATFEEEVVWLLSSLREADFHQTVVVDLTRPEFGLNVVRVLVPGLEGSDHHDAYVPGRRARALMECRI
jgi:YcaO-like protein with predicted kinase domain